jgi:hypothetical protein
MLSKFDDLFAASASEVLLRITRPCTFFVCKFNWRQWIAFPVDGQTGLMLREMDAGMDT